MVLSIFLILVRARKIRKYLKFSHYLTVFVCVLLATMNARGSDVKLNWLRVEKNQIVDSQGRRVVLRGVAIADPEHLNTKTWERPGVTARSVANVATSDFKAQVVRIPILPGDGKFPDEGFFGIKNGRKVYIEKHLRPLVQELTEKRIYVILDLHFVSDFIKVKKQVFEFWQLIAPEFRSNPYVIYEVFNEPIYPDDWNLWKSEIADPIVSLIRERAPDNLILIGGPLWSSSLVGAIKSPIHGKNIVYSAHIYSNQEPQTWDLKYGELAKLYPLFITEWGFEPGGTEGGDLNYGKKLMEWMDKRELSWTVWGFDNIWGPRVFNEDWSIKKDSQGMGEFVRTRLSSTEK